MESHIDAEFESPSGRFTRQVLQLTPACYRSILLASFCIAGGSVCLGAQLFGACSAFSLYCLVFPVPIALAVVSGAWHRLMFSARALRFRPRLFKSWPPLHWSRHVVKTKAIVDAQNLEQPIFDSNSRSSDAMMHKLRQVADDLREWHPSIVSGEGADEEEQLGLRMKITGHVQFLEHLGAYFGKEREGVRRKYPHDVLIQVMSLADLLRDQAKLVESLRMSIKVLCPTIFQDVLEEELAQGVPKHSHIHRSRLSFDAAFAMHMRDALFVESAGVRRPKAYFAWLDSSLLGGAGHVARTHAHHGGHNCRKHAANGGCRGRVDP